MKTEKCNVRTMKGCFATPHICGLKKGHKGQHCCKRKTDPEFPLSNPIGKVVVCNYKWDKRGKK